MKKFLVIFFLFGLNLIASATELPKEVQAKLKKEIPGVTIRFDGLVEYPDKTQYLPIFPMDLLKNLPDCKIVTTYPAKKSLHDKPAMILFNNNFALLKIIKNPNHNPTVVFYPEMPLCVKRGLLPQDLLVPENLVFPEELQILLGNLSIPLTKISDEFEYFKNFDRFFDPAKAQTVQNKTITPSPQVQAPKNIMYCSNFQANCIYVVDSSTGKVNRTIALRSTPSDFIITRDKRYLLVSMLGTPKLAVIDLKTQLVIKEIESGLLPTSIVVDKLQNLAYVSNQNSSTISVIDLTNMELANKIEVEGKPTKLGLSFDRKALTYFDVSSDGVYRVELSPDICKTTRICSTKNLSKSLLINDKLYIACRDKDYIMVIDTVTQKLSAKIQTCQKPVDMAVLDSKLYVVNAQSDNISVIDINTDEKIKDIALETNNFPNKIHFLDSSTRAIVTTASGYQYLIIDTIKDELAGKHSIQTIVNNLILTGRN